MASDFEKPNKVHTLFSYEIEKKMWPLPVGDLFMVGKSSAKQLTEMGILTIGVVTKPFHFEGTNRMRFAEKGIDELQQYVDTLLIIQNQNNRFPSNSSQCYMRVVRTQ